jgi:hypothetical protein
MVVMPNAAEFKNRQISRFAAVVWLALAALTRIQTILSPAPIFVFLVDNISAPEIRSSFRSGGTRFAAVAAVAA